eukprot:SAG25_NODE_221_length_11616_cov_56.164018_1_plen_68_part_10
MAKLERMTGAPDLLGDAQKNMLTRKDSQCPAPGGVLFTGVHGALRCRSWLAAHGGGAGGGGARRSPPR